MKKQETSIKNTNTTRLSKKLLKEIASSIEKTETLDTLIETLESTIDPDPSELFLLESLHQLREKILIAESRINSYLGSSNKYLPGNKLDDLYNRSYSIGSSIIFDD